MNYTKLFEPKPVKTDEAISSSAGDRRDGAVYIYNDEIVLAVNVALATGRPLLVRGKSGWGKSSLARNIALVQGCRYYEKVISSRTQARDLLYEVDLLRRLQDAQLKTLKPDFTPYVVPGVFWWAFDQESARSIRSAESKSSKDADEAPATDDAVVLLDEIDKADPDLPNNLLVPLGSLQFSVEEIGKTVKARKAPLVIITTNDERTLPAAFLRRCVELNLRIPSLTELEDRLTRVGKAHFEGHGNLAAKLAQWISSRAQSNEVPSPAEYLDALRACIELRIEPSSPDWETTSKIVLWKHERRLPT